MNEMIVNYYCLTYVKNTNPNFIVDYYDLLAEHQKKFPYINFDMMFEYKPVTKRLHAHLLLQYDQKDRKKPLKQFPFQKKGWSNVLEEVNDLGAWTAYYTKNKHNQEELINYEYQLYDEYIEQNAAHFLFDDDWGEGGHTPGSDSPTPAELYERGLDVRNI